MTMTGRRLLLTSCLFASALGLVSPAPRAQSFPMNLEGYAVADQVPASPARSTVALAPPYRAVGMGSSLLILNESDLSHPVVVAEVTLASPALAMLYRDGVLYVGAGVNGLYVMDVSNPLVPTFTSYLSNVASMALAMNEGGKILYASDGTETIQAVNVEKTPIPKRVFSVTFRYARITDLAVVGKFLVAAAGPKGLLVYELEHPGRPIRVKHFKDLEGAISLSPCPDDDHLFAVSDAYKGLVFVNFPTWQTPAIKGTLPQDYTPTEVRYLPSSNRVLVGLGAGGYAIVDGSDPSAPAFLSQSALPAPVMRVDVDSARPYLLCSGSGIYTVNVSNPSNPVASLAFPATDAFGALASSGDLVYISRGSKIEVWDCSSPYNLALVGSVDAPGFASDLLLSGNLLFAGCQQSGVALYDLSNPLSPALLSVLPVTGSAGQMDLRGNLLAVAANSQGAVLVDVSVPTAPATITSWLGKKNNFVAGVAFSSATTLWVRGDRDGVTALNVSNPAAPAELGNLLVDGLTGRCYLYSTYIVSMGGGTCTVTTSSDPTKPTLYSSIPTVSATFASFQDHTMLLSDGDTGFSELDLTTLDAPVITTIFGSPTYTYQSIQLANGARLVSAREGGLWSLLPASCAGAHLYLPCEGDTLSPVTRPIFTWAPMTGADYTVQISKEPSFPSGKTMTSAPSGKEKSTPSYMPSDGAWAGTVAAAMDSGDTMYWRVNYKVGKTTTHSEVRSFKVR